MNKANSQTRLSVAEMPKNVEGEYALLGAMMMDNQWIARAIERLTPDDFFEPFHGRVFKAMSKMHENGRMVTPITLKPIVEMDPALEGLGGLGYIVRATSDNAALLMASDMIDQIQILASRRKSMIAMADGIDALADTAEDIEDTLEIVDGIEDQIRLATAREHREKVRRLSDATESVRNRARQAESGVMIGAKCRTIPQIDEMLGPIERATLNIIGGRPGQAKAQPLDAKVLTPTGWTTMGQLKVGDALAGYDGQPSEVTGVFPQGEKQIYRITFSDGRSTECCADHLWKVRYRQWECDRVVTTEKLMSMLQAKRYTGRLSIDLFTGDFGVKSDLPIHPWLLGVILGDGGLTHGSLMISNPEDEILDRVRELLPPSDELKLSSKISYRVKRKVRSNLPSDSLQAIRDLGLDGLLSSEKFIPDVYLRAPKEDRLELLRGLMDTDGTVQECGTISYGSSSEVMAKQVEYLARSLGALVKTRSFIPNYTYRGERRVGKRHYQLNIRHEQGQDLFRLKRKSERAVRGRNATVRLNVLSIEKSRIDEAQCITVSHPSRLYVTDDFIVTHNTSSAVSMALGYAANGFATEFFHLEMKDEQLDLRVISDISEMIGQPITFEAIKKGRLGSDDFRVLERIEEMQDMLPIEFTALKTRTDIRKIESLIVRAKRKWERRKKKLWCVFIDYMQLIGATSNGKQLDDDLKRISTVCAALNEMKQKHDIAIFALAQLSRDVDRRPDKRPLMADLKGSGDLEQDADSITFCFRPEYYLEGAEPTKKDSTEWEEWNAEYQASRDKLDLICRKNRHGAPSTVTTRFIKEHYAVRSRTRRTELDEPILQRDMFDGAEMEMVENF